MFCKNVNTLLFNYGCYCLEKNENVDPSHIKSSIILFNKDNMRFMLSEKKQKVAFEWHGQFSHPHSDKHLSLLMW